MNPLLLLSLKGTVQQKLHFIQQVEEIKIKVPGQWPPHILMLCVQVMLDTRKHLS